MLARAGVPVTLIGRPAHVDAIKRHGLFLERSDFQEYVRVNAETRIEAIRDASIVLLCVKTTDTENVAAAVAPNLQRSALLVSFQNGVDNADRIRAVTGIEAAPAVVYVAAAMTGAGRVKHGGRGDIVIGNVPRLAAVFDRAQIACRT